MKLVESSLNRIFEHMTNYDSGAITGFRGDNTRAENRTKNADIRSVLRGRGYSITKVIGSYIENYGSPNESEEKEESFFVVDNREVGGLSKVLVELGLKYDQDSILFIPKGTMHGVLIGTSKRDDAWPSFGETVDVGSAKFGDTTGQFFSRIRNRQFYFE